MQILPNYNSTFNTTSSAKEISYGTKFLLVYNKFKDFIKTKFEQLRQLFMNVFSFGRKPKAMIISPKVVDSKNPLKIQSSLSKVSPVPIDISANKIIEIVECNETPLSAPSENSSLDWAGNNPESVPDEKRNISSSRFFDISRIIEVMIIYTLYELTHPQLNSVTPTICPLPPACTSKLSDLPGTLIKQGITHASQNLSAAANSLLYATSHTPPVLEAAAQTLPALTPISCANQILTSASCACTSNITDFQASIIKQGIGHASQELPKAVNSLLVESTTYILGFALGGALLATTAAVYLFYKQKQINKGLQEQLKLKPVKPIKVRKRVELSPKDFTPENPIPLSIVDSASPSKAGIPRYTQNTPPVEKIPQIPQTPLSLGSPKKIAMPNDQKSPINPTNSTAKKKVTLISSPGTGLPIQKTNPQSKPIPSLRLQPSTDSMQAPEAKFAAPMPAIKSLIHTNRDDESNTLNLSNTKYERIHHPFFNGHPAFADANPEDYCAEVEDDKLNEFLSKQDMVKISINGFIDLCKPGEMGLSELDCLLEDFGKRYEHFKRVRRMTRAWREDQLAKQKNAISLRPVGAPPPPPRSLGASANKKALKVVKPISLSETGQIYMEYDAAEKAQNEALDDLKKVLLPDSKYSKHKFSFKELQVISKNFLKDIKKIEDFKKSNPTKTPRGREVSETEQSEKVDPIKLLSKKDAALVKQIKKSTNQLIEVRKKIRLLELDINDCQMSMNELIKAINTIKPEDNPEDLRKTNKSKEMSKYGEYLQQMKKYEVELQSLQSQRFKIFEEIPTEMFSPGKAAPLKKLIESAAPNPDEVEVITNWVLESSERSLKRKLEFPDNVDSGNL